MTHQADADLLHAKEKSEGFDVRRPIGFIPGIVGNKDGVAANRTDGFGPAAMSHFHGMASGKRYGETREICDVSEGGRGGTSVPKMHVPDSGASKVLFELKNDDPIRGEGFIFRTLSRTFHEKLR